MDYNTNYTFRKLPILIGKIFAKDIDTFILKITYMYSVVFFLIKKETV